MTSPIRVKVQGAGRIIHRCARCGEPIPDEAVVMRHIDGRLVALHKEHTDGR